MTQIHRGIIRSYDDTARTAGVQLAQSFDVLTLPVAATIEPADVVAGRECTVILLTDDNPNDGAVIGIHQTTIAARPRFHTDNSLILPDLVSEPAGLAGRASLYGFAGGLRSNINLFGLVPTAITPGELKQAMLALGHDGELLANASAIAPYIETRGLMAPHTITGTENFVSSSTLGRMASFDTGAFAGNDAGINGTNVAFNKNQRQWLWVKFQHDSTANVRLWVGVTDQTLATMVSADDPAAGSYLGLSLSTDRGDTVYRWAKRNGTTQTLFNSLLAPTTNPIWVCICTPVAGNISLGAVFTESAGVLIRNSAAILSGGPAAATNLRYVFGIETRAAANKLIRIGYAHAIHDF